MPSSPHYDGTYRKAVPPPAPPAKRGEETRATRMGLDTFIYFCKKCGKEGKHSTGYLFITRYRGEELHFCDINCCDAWEKGQVLKTQPITDRRGAVAHTKAKEKE